MLDAPASRCPLPARALLLALLLGLAGLLPPVAAATPAPSLARSGLPAVGRQATTVAVPRFGRYAVLARSQQGTALQLVDAMAGPGAVAGVPGRENGRVDLFLDEGRYQVVALSHEQGTGEVALEAHAFEELNTGLAPRLPELRLVEESLADFQQRSWWIELPAPGRVVLEAAGRSLADLRLWRDGTWLVEDSPAVRVIEPVEGQPLLRCQLTAELDAGLYLLTAYGGPGQPWAAGGESHPLYLRSGTPTLGVAGRQAATLSPFGEDRFLVPGQADLFRLELPEARPATLGVLTLDEQQPFRTGGYSGAIVEESVPPATQVMASRHDGTQLVTVSGAAGQRYVLQHFPTARSEEPVLSAGPIWLSTLTSGAAADNLETTALLLRRSNTTGELQLVDAQAIELVEGHAFQRRFNLLEPATLFLHVQEAGTWAVALDDPEATIRVEPFFVDLPEGYQAPLPQRGASKWELDPGYYVLSMAPQRRGVAALTIRPHGLLDSVMGAVGMERARPALATLGGPRFPGLTVDPGWDYTLYTNRVPGVALGMVQRSLPLDMSLPLPLSLAPGEVLDLQVRIPEHGTLRIEDDQGGLLDVAVKGQGWMQQPEIGQGLAKVQVRNPGAGATAATLWFEPTRLQRHRPLQPIDMETLASIPDFPLLTAKEPVSFDLDRGGKATFRLRVEQPALYVLESTGLLATEGRLRTRTELSLYAASENGAGRNFRIQAYLGSGEYQITAQVHGMSRGHGGLRLVRTAMEDGGTLAPGVAARAEVPAGDGIAYRFRVPEEGDWDLSAIGEQRGFACRLEDGEGWPVERPGGSLPARRHLRAGDYRLVLLPTAVDTRRVTSVAPVEQPLRYAGHGPHALPLDRPVEHTWTEPQDGGERAPDRWRFELPAAVDLDLSLGDEVAGDLYPLDGEHLGEVVARVVPGMGFSGRVEAGRYELQARAARRDHGLPYTVLAKSRQLVVGSRRSVNAPSSLTVAVGAPGLLEIASEGDRDVRARLLDASGRVVASSDDRPEDWNFLIAAPLPPGRYTLRLSPVGSDWAHTTVRVGAPSERSVEALALGGARDLSPAGDVLLIPLAGTDEEGVLSLRAASAESIGLAIEARQGGTWQAVASDAGRAPLALARLGGAEAWRARLWSLDRRGNAVQLSADLLRPHRVAEARVEKSLVFNVPRQEPASALAVELDGAGLLEVGGDPAAWCPRAGQGCALVQGGLVPAQGDALWLVVAPQGTSRQVSVSARRVLLDIAGEPTAPVRFGLGDVALADLGAGLAGPVLVEARAVAGQPGVRVLDASDRKARPIPAGGMAVGERAAVAVALDARRAAALAWNADPAATGSGEVRFAAWRFPEPLPEGAAPGHLDSELPARAARAWLLPQRQVGLRVTLSTGLVAVIEGAEGVLGTWWAQGSPRELAWAGQARRLLVLNPTGSTGRVATDLIPGATPEPALVEGQPWERRLLGRGSIALALPPATAPGQVLHLRGAVRDAVVVDAEGRVWRGRDLSLPAQGGRLELEHSPGLVLAWIDAPGREGQGLWGPAASPWLVDLTAPAEVPLHGPSARLLVEPGTPLALHLRAPLGLVVGVRHGQGPLRVEAHPVADAVDVLLPGGATELLLRPLGGGELSGSLELTTTPIAPLGEGLGPELLLAPGDARFFAFKVATAGPVGLGVRADADTPRLRLLDPTGRVLGEGLAQLPELEAGTWMLSLSLDPGAAPVRAQPVVVGIALPDAGPPEAVREAYARIARTGGVDWTPVPTSLPAPGSSQDDGGYDEEGDYDEDYGEDYGDGEYGDGGYGGYDELGTDDDYGYEEE
ncbi:MAG: hypothetical protein ABIO70_25060 [Pseudomonadota bacterium]